MRRAALAAFFMAVKKSSLWKNGGRWL